MAKDPCEVTITKNLAWLVEQLVVSSHEFYFIIFLLSFYFILKINFKTLLSFFYRCFHTTFLITIIFIFFTTSSFLFLFFKSLPTSLHFSLHFHFLILFYRFTIPSLLFSHRRFIALSTYHFGISFLSSFSHSLTKKNC